MLEAYRKLDNKPTIIEKLQTRLQKEGKEEKERKVDLYSAYRQYLDH